MFFGGIAFNTVVNCPLQNSSKQFQTALRTVTELASMLLQLLLCQLKNWPSTKSSIIGKTCLCDRLVQKVKMDRDKVHYCKKSENSFNHSSVLIPLFIRIMQNQLLILKIC